MKLVKLSLAAIVVAGFASSSFAADTLADAFKNGKVSGELRSMYRDWDGAQDTTGFAVGGELGFVTDSLYGFAAGVTFQTSHNLGLDDNNAAEVDSSVAVSKTDLSEAYLSYTLGKTVVKVGRQYLDTPLASTSTSRMYNDIAEALTITNTSLPATTLVAGVVTSYQYRYGDMDNLDNEIYTIYANNKSVKGLEVTAQATYQDKAQTALYVDTAYDLPIAFPVTVGAQYIGSYYDIAGEKDSFMYGLMASTKVAGLGLSAYYNSTDNDNDVFLGYGQGSDWTYNSVQWLTGNTAGTDSYQAKISYDFAKVGVPGLSAFTRYAIYDDSVDVNNDAAEWNLDVSYKFSGAAKGLEARIRFADINYDVASKTDEQDVRVIAKYKF